MTDTINENDSYIDYDDVMARIDHLEEMRDTWEEYQNGEGDFEETPEPFGKDEQEEIDGLNELLDDCEGTDFKHGLSLINDDQMEEYIDEMVKDCYGIDEMKLPCFISLDIDYDAVKMDYTEIEFRGVTFWMR